MASGLYLAPSTDAVRLVTSSAANLDVYASFVDYTIATGVTVPQTPQLTAISSATTTTVVSAPGAGVLREVKLVQMRNRHASLAVDVIFTIDRSAAVTEMHKFTLQAGEAMEWTEATAFFPLIPVGKLDMTKYVTADYVNATTSFTDITGLTFPVIAGRNYALVAWLIAITNATTTGARFGIGGVAMTYMDGGGVSPLLAGTGATAGTYTQGRATAVDTALTGVQTTGEATNQLHWLMAGFTPSASGTLAVRGQSEVAVAAGLTVRKGSWALLRETDN